MTVLHDLCANVDQIKRRILAGWLAAVAVAANINFQFHKNNRIEKISKPFNLEMHKTLAIFCRLQQMLIFAGNAAALVYCIKMPFPSIASSSSIRKKARKNVNRQ